jgi:8-oxo-dGTP diphosphatase
MVGMRRIGWHEHSFCIKTLLSTTVYDLGHRFWLRKDGRYLIGDKEAYLLRLIDELGSVASASERAGMSGTEVDLLLRKLDEAIGSETVVFRQGRHALGDEAKEILFRYEGQARSARERMESAYRNPSLTADAVILIDGKLLLVERGREPFKGSYALPGGFLNYGETVEEGVIREVEEETGLRTMVLDLIGVYSSPDRDPRGHTVTAAFHMKVMGGELRSGDDASGVRLFHIDSLPKMAFDHSSIVDDFLSERGLRKTI